ncbi:hypothetical protein GCM10022280_12690 [Sphingomonas swuensis]|uniref:Uncharacterized protein n=1 Tax=Sphingomonas swuensis TaxID=977800 RepID=A0ABP7SR91_9SPHN
MPKHDTSDKRQSDVIRWLMERLTPEEIAAFEKVDGDEARLAEAFRLWQVVQQRKGKSSA